MNQTLFIKHAKWYYGFAAVLLLGAVAICIHGGHDDIGEWMGIAAIGLALVVANANGQLTARKKHKEPRRR